MKIAVIMSGIIKNYDHLDDLGNIFNQKKYHDFKVFGQCFDFLGNPRQARDQIEYIDNESSFIPTILSKLLLIFRVPSNPTKIGNSIPN